MEDFIYKLANSISDTVATFKKAISKKFAGIKQEKKLKCDNCGASLSGNKCEYCGTTYTEESLYVDVKKNNMSDSNN